MTQFDFFPAIPATNNSPSVDQPNMQTNNQSTNDMLAVDHVTFNVANGGTHKQITFITPLGSDPSLTGTQGEVYTKSVSGLAQLFFANSSAAIQITNSLSASSGSGQMPGGLQIRSGTASASTGGGNPVSFNTAFPTSCISVVVSYSGGGFSSAQTCSAGSVSASGFTAFSSGGATGIYYIAIGY